MNRRFDGAGIQDHEKVTAFLLYYGVLGIQTADTQFFIFNVNYDLKVLNIRAERGKAASVGSLVTPLADCRLVSLGTSRLTDGAGGFFILVMTVNPGFGGQTFLSEMLPKIRRMRQMCAQRNLDPVIEVDGGENVTTAAQTAAAGATAIVAGSALFGTKDYAAAISAMRASAAAAVRS